MNDLEKVTAPELPKEEHPIDDLILSLKQFNFSNEDCQKSIKEHNK